MDQGGTNPIDFSKGLNEVSRRDWKYFEIPRIPRYEQNLNEPAEREESDSEMNIEQFKERELAAGRSLEKINVRFKNFKRNKLNRPIKKMTARYENEKAILKGDTVRKHRILRDHIRMVLKIRDRELVAEAAEFDHQLARKRFQEAFRRKELQAQTDADAKAFVDFYEAMEKQVLDKEVEIEKKKLEELHEKSIRPIGTTTIEIPIRRKKPALNPDTQVFDFGFANSPVIKGLVKHPKKGSMASAAGPSSQPSRTHLLPSEKFGEVPELVDLDLDEAVSTLPNNSLNIKPELAYARALQTLMPGQEINDMVIVINLELVCNSSADKKTKSVMISPFFSYQVNRGIPNFCGRQLNRINFEGIKYLLMPFRVEWTGPDPEDPKKVKHYHHWVLYALDRDAKLILCLDSLPTFRAKSSLGKLLLEELFNQVQDAGLKFGDPDSYSFVKPLVDHQKNGKDCGAYLIAFAAALIHETPLTNEIDAPLWRERMKNHLKISQFKFM